MLADSDKSVTVYMLAAIDAFADPTTTIIIPIYHDAILHEHTADPLHLHAAALCVPYKMAVTETHITAAHQPLIDILHDSINEPTHDYNDDYVSMNVQTNKQSENANEDTNEF